MHRDEPFEQKLERLKELAERFAKWTRLEADIRERLRSVYSGA